MKHRICLIDDDELLGEALQERLELAGYACDWYRTGHTARTALRQKHFSAAISDIRLPDMTGEALYHGLQEEGIALPPFLFITGHATLDQAVRLTKLGAEDYLAKPFDVAELLAKVARLCEKNVAGEFRLGVSAAMRSIEALLPRVAGQQASVLITGESGVGKEWVARALHRLEDSTGRRPFIAVNCGAIPETLMEAELFGFVKGAFTGAIREKRGVFEQADGGTLFLDEIGDMPLPMQVKLLRVLQERSVQRVGAERAVPVNFRLVCATHRDLKDRVAEGSFREDLYYRIHVVEIRVPPLRERTEDIPWLTRVVLDELANRPGARRASLTPAAEQAMLAYPWPGNVRELRHLLERAVILSPTLLLTPEALFGQSCADFAGQLPAGETLNDHLRHCEREFIRRVLAENNGRIADSAESLGISRKGLWEKMKRLGISGEGREGEV